MLLDHIRHEKPTRLSTTKKNFWVNLEKQNLSQSLLAYKYSLFFKCLSCVFVLNLAEHITGLADFVDQNRKFFSKINAVLLSLVRPMSCLVFLFMLFIKFKICPNHNFCIQHLYCNILFFCLYPIPTYLFVFVLVICLFVIVLYHLNMITWIFLQFSSIKWVSKVVSWCLY